MEENKIPKTEDESFDKTQDEWKTFLTPEQYRVLRQSGTEAAYTGKYYKNKETGMYVCGACGQELFSSETKFDSGTGWPSFSDPVNKENVELKTDMSHGPTSPRGFGRVNMTRTEVLCKRCGSHLGHVFDDGPKDKGGKRYCINSVSLDFNKKDEEK